MEKQHVQLSEGDRGQLTKLLSKGHLSARQFKQATGLLELDRGKPLQAVAQTLGVNYNTVAAWRNHYQQRGLEALQGQAPFGTAGGVGWAAEGQDHRPGLQRGP